MYATTANQPSPALGDMSNSRFVRLVRRQSPKMFWVFFELGNLGTPAAAVVNSRGVGV
jgi:hypothetical protein